MQSIDMNQVVGRCSVLLMTFDTLRYDVAAALFAGGRTPHLARLIPQGWQACHSPATFTYAAHQAFFAGFLPTPARPGRHERLLAARFAGSETTTANTCVFDAPDIVSGFAQLGYRTVCIGGVGFFNRKTPLGCVLPGLFAESYWEEAFGVTNPGTFTWGFNNAAPLYRVALLAGNQVQMLTEPKDQYHWPRTGQVVELLPWSAVLPNGQKIAALSGHLARVGGSFDPDSGIFTLEAAMAPPPGFGLAWQSRPDARELGEPATYFYLRVWDRGDDRSSPPEIPFTDGTPVALGTTGLAVTFTGPDRVAEDHWVIAVRPETPNQVVPWELEEGMLPHGVRRFFAPLAVISWQSAGGQLQGQVVHDCRKTFRPLTDLDGCCTFTVGDGIRSRGDFNAIEEAVGNLPPAGGKICVLPGVHEANVTIVNHTQIRITGCGEQTVVRPHGDDNRRGQPIFRIAASRKIQLDNLMMEALEGTAIVVEDQDPKQAPSQEITIRDNSILAGVHGIRVSLPEDRRGNNAIDIHHNRVAILDQRGGDVAIFVAADEVRIERNRVAVLPPPDLDDPDDPRNEDGPDDLFDPCPDRKGRYRPGYPLRLKLSRQFAYLAAYVPANQKNVYTALGGIQIGGASERVLIRQNEIIGGRGNGITLGHLPAPGEEQLRAKTFERRGEHAYATESTPN